MTSEHMIRSGQRAYDELLVCSLPMTISPLGEVSTSFQTGSVRQVLRLALFCRLVM